MSPRSVVLLEFLVLPLAIVGCGSVGAVGDHPADAGSPEDDGGSPGEDAGSPEDASLDQGAVDDVLVETDCGPSCTGPLDADSGPDCPDAQAGGTGSGCSHDSQCPSGDSCVFPGVWQGPCTANAGDLFSSYGTCLSELDLQSLYPSCDPIVACACDGTTAQGCADSDGNGYFHGFVGVPMALGCGTWLSQIPLDAGLAACVGDAGPPDAP